LQGSRRTLVLRTAAIAFGALALMPAVGYADGLTPESPASPGTEDTQIAYVVMAVLATLIALAVIGGLIAAARGRAADGDEREPRTRGTSRIQRRVGVGLGLLATAVFVFGIIVTESARKVEPTGADGLATAQLNLKPPPGDAKPLEIGVTGQQWLWRYEYPDGTFSYYEMVVPVDTAVVLNIESTDVLHSWWVPALTGMFEVAPGSANKAWFKADELGTYEGRSTQFSGDAYASMRAAVRVVEPAEYEAWLAQQAEGIQKAQESVAEQVESGTGPGAGLG
jgi:cytochrome c oxidase subunit 2